MALGLSEGIGSHSREPEAQSRKVMGSDRCVESGVIVKCGISAGGARV